MEIAFIGFLGVILGALTSAGIQYHLDRQSRKIALRAARRLTCTELYKVLAVTEGLAESAAWGAERDPLPTRAYSEYSLIMAGSMPWSEWKRLRGSLLGVERLEGIRVDMLVEDRDATQAEVADAQRIRQYIKETLKVIDTENVAIKPHEQPT